MKYTAGIDNGTQSTKVLIFDYENRKIVQIASAPHELISRKDGTREQEAQWWIDALKACFEQIPDDVKKSIIGIGVSGQQHGFVPVDKEGNVIRPVKLWNDTSTSREAERINNTYGGYEKITHEVGNPVLPGYTASKILWLREQHPQTYEKVHRILLPHDYLNFFLTGSFWMEHGDASGTAFLDIKKRDWDKRVLSIIDDRKDLTELLPPFIESHEIGGYVRKEAAELFGIPEGIPVSSGGGDNMMSAAGTGVIRDGDLAISLGTSGTMYGYSSKPIIDEKQRLAGFCSSTGGWLPLLCTMNCTVGMELYKDMYDIDVKTLDAVSAEANPGSDGVLTIPFFNGERTPNLPYGKGCLVGMDSTNTTKANMLRSSLESAIFGMLMGLEAFEELGFTPESTYLVGGGAKSPLWRQISADILNIPVKLPPIEETAAFGGALQALWAIECRDKGYVDFTEIFDSYSLQAETEPVLPDPENAEIYKHAYASYKEYVETLTPLFTQRKE